MGNTRLWLWGGATALILTCAASIGRSRGSEGRPVDADQRFVRVGDFYINASRIDYVVRESDGLVVVFGSEAGNRLKLSGTDAVEMKRWLDERAVVAERPRQGGYSQQGDSSRQPGPQQLHGPDSGSMREHPQQAGPQRKQTGPQRNNPPGLPGSYSGPGEPVSRREQP